MHFSSSLLLALPILVAASNMRPARSYIKNPLAPRDTNDNDDDLHDTCSVDGKEPKDCGMGYCCFYYEECQAGTGDEDHPWCLDMSLTSVGGEPYSAFALQFATTGFASAPADAKPTTTGDSKPNDSNGPTNTAGANPAATTGAAVNNKVSGLLGLGMLAGFAGVFV